MKDFLNQFDLDNAFKALDELEYPTVKGGIRPNRVDLHEHFSRKQKTDLLIEEYYNVSSDADLEAAQDQREDEVAQAKLDRIEKIVDLDADSEEDLQAAYVGKFVVQCPQCMTLFYKKPEDVTTSEEDPTLANVGELCPNCSNDSGFTVVGKIEDATPEAAPAEEAPAEGEETGMDEVSVEGEEAPAEGGEEDLDLDLDLGDLDLDIEETEEQEPAEESLNLSKALKDASKKTELDTENHSENLTLNESNDKECEDGKCDGNCEGQECDESINNSKAQKNASKNTELDTENHSENLTLNEDTDLKKELGDYNEYIEYLQKEIEADEAALKAATNDFVKDSIQRRIDANKADLDSAMPEILKNATAEDATLDNLEVDIGADGEADVAAEEVPAGEEQVEVEETEVKEALNEARDNTECESKIEEDFWGDERKGAYHKCPDIAWADDGTSIIYNGRKFDGDAIESELWGRYIEKTNTPNEKYNDPMVSRYFDKFVCAEGKKFLDDVLADEQKYSYLIKENINEGEKAITEAGGPSEAELDQLYNSPEFKTPVEQSTIDKFFSEGVEDDVDIKSIEELDDKSLTEAINGYLKEVYEDVNDFSLTECQFNEETNQLIVEGLIKFDSGKTKTTKFMFNPCGANCLEGYNFDICDTKAFTLGSRLSEDKKTLFTESLGYHYHIKDDLVEGLIKK